MKKTIEVNCSNNRANTGGSKTKVTFQFEKGLTYYSLQLYAAGNGVANAAVLGFLANYVEQIELKLNGKPFKTFYPNMLPATTAQNNKNTWCNRKQTTALATVGDGLSGYNRVNIALHKFVFAELLRTNEGEIFGPALGTSDPMLKSFELELTLNALPGGVTERSFYLYAVVDDKPRSVGMIEQNVVTFPTTNVGRNSLQITLPPASTGSQLLVSDIYLIPTTDNVVYSNVSLRVGTQVIASKVPYQVFRHMGQEGIVLTADTDVIASQLPSDSSDYQPLKIQFDALTQAECIVMQNPAQIYLEFDQDIASTSTLVLGFYGKIF